MGATALAKYREGRFKNCVECGRYLPVDAKGRCQDCFEVERDLLDAARQRLQEQPDMTIEELSHKMGVDEERVADWMRDGRVKCVAIRKKCPNCGRVMVNRFSCDSCGYNKPPDPALVKKEEIKKKKAILDRTPLRVSMLREAYWGKHSQIQPSYQKRHLWLIPRKGYLLNRP